MSEKILEDSQFVDALCAVDKVETVAKVLNQTLYENSDFDAKDSQNLCSVLLREISYTKSRLSIVENNLLGKSSCR